MPETDATPKKDSTGFEKPSTDLEKYIATLRSDRDANTDSAGQILLRDSQFMRPMITAGNECYRCHPKRPDENFKLSLMDSNFSSFDRLYKQKPESPEEKDRRVEREFKAAPVEQKLLTVFSRLPEKAAIEVGKDSVSIRTDFAKAIEAVPGAHLDDVSRKTLSSLQSLALDKDAFTAKFSGEQCIGVNKDIPLLGALKEIKLSDGAGQLKFDLKLDGTKAEMNNIRGLRLVMEDGRELAIHSLGLSADEKGSKINLTIDNPGKKPDWMGDALWPKTLSVPVPVDMAFPQTNSGTLSNLLKTCAEAKNVLKDRNFSAYLSGISEEGLKGTLDKILAGASRIEKSGDHLQITRNNGEFSHNLNGATLKVGESVGFRLGTDPKAPSVSDISGVSVAVPLPSELGIGDALESVKSVSLGRCSYSGARDLQIKMGPLVDSIRLSLGKDMQPVKDSDGNWGVGLQVQNLLSNSASDRISMYLRIGADGNLNMKPSEILDIVSSATGQAADFSFKGAFKAGVSGGTQVISSAAWLLGY